MLHTNRHKVTRVLFITFELVTHDKFSLKSSQIFLTEPGNRVRPALIIYLQVDNLDGHF